VRSTTIAFLVALLLTGCAVAPEVSDDVHRIQDWEKSLTVKLDWPVKDRQRLEDAVLEVHADDLPKLGKDVHFHGQTYVDVNGYLIFMADIGDSHSNIQNAGVMRVYESMRSGIFKIRYRYTFYRSYSKGPSYQDRFLDWDVLYSGEKTITLKKSDTPQRSTR
jgi:hypothetical protein